MATAAVTADGRARVLADGNEVALEHGSKTLMASRIVDAIVALLQSVADRRGMLRR